MLDVFTRLLPPTTRYLHQVAPSVIATLIAAGLISGYNRAFSTHIKQPRMAALHDETDIPLAPVPATVISTPANGSPATTSTAAMTTPAAGPVTEYITIHERAAPQRIPEKDAKAEAGKDQSPMTAVAVAAPLPTPRPAEPRVTDRRPEPRVIERRTEPRVASVPQVIAPVTAQPLPAPAGTAPVATAPVGTQPSALPPPVIMAPPSVSAEQQQPPGTRPYVTVPDRPYQRPTQEASADDVIAPPPRPQGPLGVIVNTLNPMSLLSRAREFGEKIEQAGNDILPSIRQ